MPIGVIIKLTWKYVYVLVSNQNNHIIKFNRYKKYIPAPLNHHINRLVRLDGRGKVRLM